MPSLLMMKPEPSPRIGTSRDGMPPRAPGIWPKNWAKGSSSLADTLRVPLTLMLTTAGPKSRVICAKLGGLEVLMDCGAAIAVGALAAIDTPPITAVAPAPPMAPAASSASIRREGFSCEVFMSAPAFMFEDMALSSGLTLRGILNRVVPSLFRRSQRDSRNSTRARSPWPPGASSRRISAPCWSAMARAIDNPSPLPCCVLPSAR
ncbi:hypothetical protein D3C87_1373600 [compost metagenome]